MRTLEIGLRPTQDIQSSARDVRAWFLPGGRPANWLKILSEAEPSLSLWRLYVVPLSMRDRRPGGVLAVLDRRPPELSVPGSVIAYRCRVDSIFLPLQSEIFPSVSDDELARECLYDVTIFHPAAGLVGYDSSEALSVTDLLSPPQKRVRDWTRAQPGPRMRPPFQSAKTSLLPPSQARSSPSGSSSGPGPSAGNASLKQMFQDIEQDIGSQARPPQELTEESPPEPKNDQDFEQEPAPEAEGWLKKGVAKTVLWLTDKAPKTAQDETWVDRVSSWARQTLDQIKERREREIDRLLRLLKDDPDQALKHALPLSSRNFSGAQGGRMADRLPEHDVDFRLDAPQTGASDPWQLSAETMMELRREYRQAANRELRMGRVRRAAYIYSELLGDDRQAATVLEQGGFYFEAAVIYQQRLNLPWAAALALRRGGHYHEALEIYEELQAYEAMGDLYSRLDKPEEARASFNRAVDSLITSGNYLRAGELAHSKVQDADRALEIFDRAWPDHNQAEECLNAKLKLYGQLGRHKDCERYVQQFWSQSLSPGATRILVASFVDMARAYPHESQRSKFADEALRFVGRDLDSANRVQARRLLESVAKLDSQDRLLQRDCQRYLRERGRPKVNPFRSSSSQTPSQVMLLERYQLPRWATWYAAQAFAGGFLAAGLSDEGPVLCFSRGHSTEQLCRWTMTGRGRDPFTRYPSERVILAPSMDGRGPIYLRFPEFEALEESSIWVDGREYPVKTPAFLGHESACGSYEFGRARIFWGLRQSHKRRSHTLYKMNAQGQLLESHDLTHCLTAQDIASVEDALVHGIEQDLERALDDLLVNEQGDFELRLTEVEDPYPFARFDPLLCVSSRTLIFVAYGRSLLRMPSFSEPASVELPGPIGCLAVSPMNCRVRLVLGLDRGAMLLQDPSDMSSLKPFALGMSHPRVAMTGNNFMVVASPGRGRVYRDVQQIPVAAGDFELPSETLLEVLPGPGLDGFTVISQSGSVLRFKTPSFPRSDENLSVRF